MAYTYRARRTVSASGTDVAAEPVAETASEPTDPTDFSSLKKDELVAAAEKRDIDASGTKADIIERLEQAGA